MDWKDAKNDPLYHDARRLVSLLRERFLGETDHIFKNILALFTNHNGGGVEPQVLFSQLSHLLGPKHHDLIPKFEFFLFPGRREEAFTFSTTSKTNGFHNGKFDMRLYDSEEEMEHCDMLLGCMEQAKIAARYLVQQNSGGNPREIIKVKKYFKVSNFGYVRKELAEKYRDLLEDDRGMLRGRAIQEAKQLISALDGKFSIIVVRRNRAHRRWRSIMFDLIFPAPLEKTNT